MKRYLLASLVTLAGWAGFVQGQASLGTPIANQTPCESCGSAVVLSANHADCKSSFCQSGIGQLAKSMMAPLRLATGNLLPVCCVETVSKEDVARMVADGGYSQAEIAAIKIKLDESQASARRAAVRYLATVDCHYYPEAENGLIAALRADRSECVRFEAALALGTCRCVSSRIVDALSIATMGCEIDGNPAERSPRVRSAAQAALNRCLSQCVCVPATPPQMLPPPDWSAPMPFPAAPQQPSLWVQPMNYFVPAPPEPISPALQYERSRAENVGASPGNASLATGQRNVYHLFVKATNPSSDPSASRAAAPRPAAPRSQGFFSFGTEAKQATPAHPLGLTPLGSEFNLAIPRGNPPGVSSVSPSRYNE